MGFTSILRFTPNTSRIRDRPSGPVVLLIVWTAIERDSPLGREGSDSLTLTKMSRRYLWYVSPEPRVLWPSTHEFFCLIPASFKRLSHSLDWNCGPWSSWMQSGYPTYFRTQVFSNIAHTSLVRSLIWRKHAALKLVSLSKIWRTDFPSRLVRPSNNVLLETIYSAGRETQSRPDHLASLCQVSNLDAIFSSYSKVSGVAARSLARFMSL